MENTCRNCLAQDVCDITGASCKKMDALFAQHKTIRNGRTTMTNTAKNTTASTTPKDVKEKVEEKTVPSQATEPKTGEKETKDAQSEEKLTLVKRAKAAAEKLKQNKKALLILTGAAVVVGLTIKSNRKAVAVEPLGEAEGPINGVEGTDPDETTDSL